LKQHQIVKEHEFSTVIVLAAVAGTRLAKLRNKKDHIAKTSCDELALKHDINKKEWQLFSSND